MVESDLIARFVASLQVAQMPNEFILSAKITDEDGSEQMLIGEKLEKLLNGHADYQDIKMAMVYLNIGKVYSAIETEVTYVYSMVDKIYNESDKSS